MKTAPKSWNRCIDGFLVSHAFEAVECDPCFYRHISARHTCLLLYVDDLQLVSLFPTQLDNFEESLAALLAIKLMRCVKEIFGLKLRRST